MLKHTLMAVLMMGLLTATATSTSIARADTDCPGERTLTPQLAAERMDNGNVCLFWKMDSAKEILISRKVTNNDEHLDNPPPVWFDIYGQTTIREYFIDKSAEEGNDNTYRLSLDGVVVNTVELDGEDTAFVSETPDNVRVASKGDAIYVLNANNSLVRQPNVFIRWKRVRDTPAFAIQWRKVGGPSMEHSGSKED